MKKSWINVIRTAADVVAENTKEFFNKTVDDVKRKTMTPEEKLDSIQTILDSSPNPEELEKQIREVLGQKDKKEQVIDLIREMDSSELDELLKKLNKKQEL